MDEKKLQIVHADLDSDLDTLYNQSVDQATAYVTTTKEAFQVSSQTNFSFVEIISDGNDLKQFN